MASAYVVVVSVLDLMASANVSFRAEAWHLSTFTSIGSEDLLQLRAPCVYPSAYQSQGVPAIIMLHLLNRNVFFARAFQGNSPDVDLSRLAVIRYQLTGPEPL